MNCSAIAHDRANCVLCIHDQELGWWGPGFKGTHCRDCGATWTGVAAAHTVCCHVTFGGNTTADKYHDAFDAMNGDCPTEHDLAEAGVVLTNDQRGRVWRSTYPGPDAARAGRDDHAGTEPPDVTEGSVCASGCGDASCLVCGVPSVDADGGQG